MLPVSIEVSRRNDLCRRECELAIWNLWLLNANHEIRVMSLNSDSAQSVLEAVSISRMNGVKVSCLLLAKDQSTLSAIKRDADSMGLFDAELAIADFGDLEQIGELIWNYNPSVVEMFRLDNFTDRQVREMLWVIKDGMRVNGRLLCCNTSSRADGLIERDRENLKPLFESAGFIHSEFRVDARGPLRVVVSTIDEEEVQSQHLRPNKTRAVELVESEVLSETVPGSMSALRLHARRLLVEIINVFFNYDWCFRLVGKVNEKVGVIQSVFLVYPGNEKYSSSYLYPKRIAKAEWQPSPVSILWQNRRMILMFCITASNEQFTDPCNITKVKKVVERMEHLRMIFYAGAKTFAGILPGVLYTNRIVREAPEADLTATAVAQAILSVKSLESMGPETPIILLGHRGFIGRRVAKLLDPKRVYGVDRGERWPTYLTGRRVLVVNITLNGAITKYLNSMWPGTVVVNEVYPEPAPGVVAELKRRGCILYHISGVEGKSFPSFPEAYEGAIPCCAAWHSPHLKAVVRKLT